MKKNILFIKIIILLIPVLVFVWIFNKQYAPLGKLEVVYDFSKESPFISDLYPELRTDGIEKEDGDYLNTIHEDTVYFDLILPRLYKKARVKVVFKGTSPIFDIGGEKEKDVWAFEMRPLENKIIDQLGWPKIEEGNLTLWQKNKNYNKIHDLIDKSVVKEKIATYHFNEFNKDIKLDNYEKSNQGTEINYTLRGPHLMYTYIKDEELDFTFNMQDINRAWNEDIANISVYKNKNGEKVYNKVVSIDEDASASNQISSIKEVQIKIPNLEEGIYKVELSTNDDLLTRKIKTKQKLLVFERQLFLAESNEYIASINENKSPITFYNTGNNITIETPHPNSLQTVQINDQNLEIEEVNKKYVLGKDKLSAGEFDTIKSPRSDLYLESNGYFVFSLDNMLYPKPPNIITMEPDTNMNEINYIIAKYYEKPKLLENDWREAQAEFDLGDLYIDEDSKIKFLLSAPGLRDSEGEIKISEIKIILEKDPITIQNIISKLKNFIKKN